MKAPAASIVVYPKNQKCFLVLFILASSVQVLSSSMCALEQPLSDAFPMPKAVLRHAGKKIWTSSQELLEKK